MKHITIFGKGNMGKVIADRFTQAGNTVTSLDSKDKVGTLGDIVVLAVPYPAVDAILSANAKQLQGKILIDITNPVNFQTMDGLVVPADSSAAQLIAQRVPGARVIKAFNTNFAATLAGEATVLAASDDEDAKAVFAKALEGSGLTVVDAGALKRARELEALGFLQITFAIRGVTGWTGGFRLVK